MRPGVATPSAPFGRTTSTPSANAASPRLQGTSPSDDLRSGTCDAPDMAKRVHRQTLAVLTMLLRLVMLAVGAAALLEGGRWIIAVGFVVPLAGVSAVLAIRLAPGGRP